MKAVEKLLPANIGLGLNALLPEQQPMTTQNYVSIMKRKDMERSLMQGGETGLSFEPKIIGGRIGAILDL